MVSMKVKIVNRQFRLKQFLLIMTNNILTSVFFIVHISQLIRSGLEDLKVEVDYDVEKWGNEPLM